MTFWFGAAFLAVMACAFVLLPLLLVRRDEHLDEVDRDQLNVALFVERTSDQQDEELTSEAQKDLLADTAEPLPARSGRWGDRRMVFAAAMVLPVFAFLVYGDLGMGRGAIHDVAITERLAKLDPADTKTYAQFAADVQARLAVHPDDEDMQYLLASVYGGLGRYDEAAAIYQEMLARFPDDANLLSQYAEVLFAADQRRLTPRTVAAIDAALKANPVNVTMLELRGIGAITEGQPAEALTWFERALGTGVTGRRAELLRLAVARIRMDMGGDTAGASSRALLIELSLAESIDAPDSSVVFVYARAASGPAAPLAVRRLSISELPATVRLDDTMAMVPGMSLANFDEVNVIARLSLSGEVAPSPGDVEVRSETVIFSEAEQDSDQPITLSLVMEDVLK